MAKRQLKIIVCACGCPDIKREDMIITKVNSITALRCPNHAKLNIGKGLHALITCLDCPTIFQTSLRKSKRKKRCDSCQAKRTRKLAYAANKKYRERMKKEKVTIEVKGRGSSVWY